MLDTFSEVLSPLSEETAKLLKPLKLLPNDRIAIGSAPNSADKLILAPYSRQSVSTGDVLGRASFWARATQWGRRIPERKQLDDGRLLVAATDFTVAVVTSIWGEDRIGFADDEARDIWRYIVLGFKAGMKRALNTAEYKAMKLVPPNDLILHDELPISDYQKVAALNAMNAEGYANFSEQGAGKTAPTICRIDHCGMKARSLGHTYKVLIVAPKNVRTNWLVELERFGVSKGVRKILQGDKLACIRAMADTFREAKDQQLDYACLVTSYGLMWRRIGILTAVEWDLIVCDESHMIKSPKAKQTKGALKLRDSSKSREILTGTCLANRLGDLYSQLEFLGKGFSGFSTYKAFCKYYHQTVKTASGFDVVTGFKNIPMLKERIARNSFAISKREALPDLPSKIRDIVDVEMTDYQKKIYNTLATEIVAEIESDIAGASEAKKTIILSSSLKKMLRLSEVTSGFVKYDVPINQHGEAIGEAEVERIDPNPKLEELIEILKKKKLTEKAIVWVCYTQDIRTLSARFTVEGIDHVKFYGGTSDTDRAIALDRFNNDTACRVFLSNPAAGGTGVNLLGHADEHTNCDHAIYFSQNWSSIVRTQSEDRPHRRGTRVPIRITDLCMMGTIDAEIREAVTQKMVTALDLKDVRQILGRILKCNRI